MRPGAVEEYEQARHHAWLGLLAKVKEVGISDHSIFRRRLDLFLVMTVEDFERAWKILEDDPANLRWQKEMGHLFDPITDLSSGERFALMKEVFYME